MGQAPCNFSTGPMICERGHMNLITLAFIAEPIFRSASRVYGRCRKDSGVSFRAKNVIELMPALN